MPSSKIERKQIAIIFRDIAESNALSFKEEI